MKTKLITGLRTAANALENGTFYYNWEKPGCCNCGSLFCALTGSSAAQLKVPKAINGENATWTTLIGQHCPITGIPADRLFKELFGYGLTQRDMVNLEYLSDEAVVRRTGILTAKRAWWQRELKQLDYENKGHVIAYMRAWADLLTEEGSLDVASPEPQQVKCPNAELSDGESASRSQQ